MGILEQILESNKLLSEQLVAVQEEISTLKNEMKATQLSKADNDTLTLKFQGKDKLNASMAAKLIGITITELFDVVDKGRLCSIGKKKRIFYAEEVLRYIHGTSLSTPQSSEKLKIVRKKKTKTIRDVISDKDIKELIANQAV